MTPGSPNSTDQRAPLPTAPAPLTASSLVQNAAVDPVTGLNPAQADAATHSNSPLLIVAGAGTGKTRTLVHRVAWLIHSGVPANRILLLTFTRRSAAEMIGRSRRLVGEVSQQVQGGTFHGVANRLLRRFGKPAGLPADFTILDQSDAADLVALSRTALGYNNKPLAGAPRFPRAETLIKLYSRHINTDIPIEELLEEEFPHFIPWVGDIERVLTDYVRRKAESNLLDYDDLLLSWALLLEHESPVAQAIRSLYDHVLVDEYQDTNPLQSRILRGLCHNGHITVVGDDAQSIYAFRGATVRNILDFPTHFPGTRIVTLEQNYRSSPYILETSNALISRAAERYTKDLFTDRTDGEPPWLVTVRDEAEQTRFVIERLMTLHEEGIPLKEMAVLVRAGRLSADLEIELTNQKIPYTKWGGIKFLEAAHIKDVLAFLRILENPRDEVGWFRVLCLLPGVGTSTAQTVIGAIAANGWKPSATASAIASVAAPARARTSLRSLAALLSGLQHGTSPGPAEEIRIIRQLYDGILKDTYDDAPFRMADLDQLEIIASGYPGRTEFLAALVLEPPQSTQDVTRGTNAEEDVLVISTVHSAKGKEWDAVFVMNVADGIFPISRAAISEEEVEEERRLLYVAMTRARHHLYVTFPMNSYSSSFGAAYSISQLSRFLDPGVQDTMHRLTIADDTGETLPALPTPGEAVPDLRALLRARFDKS